VDKRDAAREVRAAVYGHLAKFAKIVKEAHILWALFRSVSRCFTQCDFV
jgi:hypothetical protein